MGVTATTNHSTTLVISTGGAVTVAIASNVGRGNGGTSLPCKGCLVVAQAGNTAVVKMNIGIAASASLGIEVPQSDQGGATFVPIDDVAKLYFYGGTNGDDIDILYFL